MKRITGIKTRYYEDGDYIIAVVDKGDEWNAYITHKEYGYIRYLYGEPKVQPSLVEYNGQPYHTPYKEYLERLFFDIDTEKELYMEDIETLENR